MRYKKKAFLQILLIELKDLEADIELLIRKLEDSHDQELINNYVFYENVSLMQRELFGVEGFYRELLGYDSDPYETLEELEKGLEHDLDEWCGARGLPRSVGVIVKRKMRKVLQYVEHGSVPVAGPDVQLHLSERYQQT